MRRSRQFICEKHGACIVWEDENGILYSGQFNGAQLSGCPKCRTETQNKIIFAILTAALFLVVGLFYKIPKMIYEKYGKKGLMIYVSCWLGVILTFGTIKAVKAYNEYQKEEAYRKQWAEEQAAEKKARFEKQAAELRAKTIESQERMRAKKKAEANKKAVK